jgi:steroid 5-alpha reductase family enzyme
MQKLNIPLMCTLLLLSLVVCPILYIYVGPALNDLQLETLKILGIIAGCSALYCFIVAEITGNNSQVDKIWSLLPIAYCWIIAAKGGMHPRLVVIAVLVTLWGIRLTYNFARKGAYKLRFWEGEEDYRWEKVRAIPFLQNKAVWMTFDFFFISGYQNALILMFTFPALVCMGSTAPFGWVDIVAAILMFGFIVYETVADEQQWKFQGKKWAMIKSGKRLEELPAPYNKGFNTFGLWNVSRHPNYFAEQAIWVSLYIFSIGAGVGIVNWSMIGALLLIVLFTASTNLVEGISGDKYPEYAEYCKKVNKFFPGKKYRG